MTENTDLSPEMAAWAESKGFSNPERVSGGRNNRIFKLQGQHGAAALKVYYRGPGDRRDRFSAELACYALAANRGVSAPELLDADEQLGVSLLGWIQGVSLNGNIGEEDVRAAADFLVTINEPLPAEPEVPCPASEACFSTEEHLELLANRINRLQQAAPGVSSLAEFLGSTLSPFFERVRRSLLADREADFRRSGEEKRIFSPGDFGLHNAMRRSDGRVVFFDFEYSGWDDPVKTVADVFLQPEQPVEWKFLPDFCAQLGAWPALEKRVRAWLPFFAAKWAVILLGPSANEAAERRRFAGEELDEATMLRQIAKASNVVRRVTELIGSAS